MPMTDEQKKLVENNINLARYLANKWISRGIRNFNYDDLFSLFLYALCKASVAFNPNYGAKFSTYAMVCMNNEVKMAFRKMITSREYFEWGEVVNQDEEGNLLRVTDIVSNADHLKYDHIIDLMILKEALTILTDREKNILKFRFYCNDTQEQTAAKLKISRAYVCRIENKSFLKLRKHMEE
jgi:RNA polymerase sporulation-specific sigma factor